MSHFPFSLSAHASLGIENSFQNHNQPTFGNAKIKLNVNSTNGNFCLEDRNISIPDVNQVMHFSYVYNSQAKPGEKWRFAHTRKIEKTDHEDVIYVVEKDGRTINYLFDQDSKCYVSSECEHGKCYLFYDDENNYRRVDSATNTTERFNKSGQLISITDQFSNITSFHYQDNELSQVILPSGIKYDIERSSDKNQKKIELIKTDGQNREKLHTYTLSLDGVLLESSTPDDYKINYGYHNDVLTDVKQSDTTTIHIKQEQSKLSELIFGEDKSNRYQFTYDENATNIIKPNGNKTVINYDPDLSYIKVNNQEGYREYHYAPSRQITRIKHIDNSETTFQYDEKTSLCTFINNRDGSCVEYNYNSENSEKPILISDKKLMPLSQHYVGNYYLYKKDSNGNNILSYEINQNGLVTQYQVDEHGLTIEKRHYLNAAYEINMNDMPTLDDIQDWAKQHVSDSRLEIIKRDKQGLINEIKKYTQVNEEGDGINTSDYYHEKILKRNSYGLICEKKIKLDDENEQNDLSQYDHLNRQTLQTLGKDSELAQTTTTHYDAGTITKTLTNGLLVLTTLNTAGETASQTTKVDDETRTTKILSYPSENLKIEETPCHNKHYHYYDEKNRPVIEISPAGNVVETNYFPTHRYNQRKEYANPLDINSLCQKTAYFTYLMGYPVTPKKESVLVALKNLADKEDRVSYQFFNVQNKLHYDVDPENHLIEYRYDHLGQLLHTIAYAEKITEEELSQLKAGIEIKRHPNRQYDRVKSYFYKNDQLIAEQDQAGYITEYQLDVDGRKIKNIHYATTHLEFSNQYDDIKPLAKYEDAYHYYFYDALNRVKLEVDAEGYANLYTYNKLGLKQSLTRFIQPINTKPTAKTLLPLRNDNDYRENNTYDTLGRLTTTVKSTGEKITYTYDEMNHTIKTESVDDFSQEMNDPETYRAHATQYDPWKQKIKSVNPYVMQKIRNIECSQNMTLSEKEKFKDKFLKELSDEYYYNDEGLQIRHKNAKGHATVYYYNKNNELVLTVDPTGKSVEYTRNSFGDIVVKHNYYHIISKDNLSKLTGGYLDDSITKLLSKSDKDIVITHSYDHCGRLINKIDPEGHLSTYRYNAFDECVEENVPVNEKEPTLKITREFEPRGHIAKVMKIADGKSILNEQSYAHYLGKLTETKNSEGCETKMIHDKLGREIRVEELNESGQYKTSFEKQYDGISRGIYGKSGQVVKKKEYQQKARTLKVSYDATTGSEIIKTNVFGETISRQINEDDDTILHQEKFTHAPDGKLASVVDGVGHTTYFMNDILGHEEFIIKPNKSTIKYTRNESNDLCEKETKGKGIALTETYTPNAFGLNERTVGTDDIETSHTYDKCKNLTESCKDPNNLKLKTTHEHNALGLETIRREGDDQDFIKTETVYDGLGRKNKTITDPDGLAITTSVDMNTNGKVIKEIDPENNTKHYLYNKLNQKRFEVIETNTNRISVTEYTYTETGKIESIRQYHVIDPQLIKNEISLTHVLNSVKKNKHDAVTHFFYDEKDREVFKLNYVYRQSQFMTMVTENKYDPADRLIRHTQYADYLPLENIFPWQTKTVRACIKNIKNNKKTRMQNIYYDKASHPRLIIDEKGIVTEKRYDEMGNNVMQIAYANTLKKEQYHNKSCDDILSVIDTNPEKDQIQAKVIDALGRTTYEISNNGCVTKNTFSRSNLISEIRQFNVPITLDYSYDHIIKQIAQIKPDDDNDRVSTIEYDNLGHVINVKDALGFFDHYKRTVLGSASEHTDRNKHVWTFQYDHANRLIEEKSPLTSISEVTQNEDGRLHLNSIKTNVAKKIKYDRLNNATEITQGFGLDSSRTFQATYTHDNQLTTTQLNNITVDDPFNQIYLQKKSLASLPQKETTLSTRKVYDERNNKIVEINELGHASFYVYDNVNRLIYELKPKKEHDGKIIDENMIDYGVIHYEYNALSEVENEYHYEQAIHVNPDNHKSTGITRDLVSLLIEKSDLDRTRQYAYEGANELAKITSAKVNYYHEGTFGKETPVTKKRYDVFGNCIYQATLISPENWAEKFSWYDKNNHVIAEVDEDHYLTISEYDLNSNVIKKTEYAQQLSDNFTNQIKSYTNDVENDDQRSLPVTFAELKKYVTLSDKDRLTEYEYDKLNQKIAETKKNVTTHSLNNTVQPNVPPTIDTHEKTDVTRRWTYTPTQKLSSYSNEDDNKEHYFYDERDLLIGTSKVTRTSEDRNRKAIDLTPVTLFKVNAHGQVVGTQNTQVSIPKSPGTKTITTKKDIENCINKPLDNPSYDVLIYHDKRGLVALKQFADNHLLGYTYTADKQKARELEEAYTDNNTHTHIDEKRYQYDLAHHPIQYHILRDGISEEQTYSAYNVFDELMGMGDLPNQMQMYQKANNNGRVWQTNAERGINTLLLHDLRGLETLRIQSEKEDLSKISEDNIHDVLTWPDNKVERIETRYDQASQPTHINMKYSSEVPHTFKRAIPQPYRHYEYDRWGNVIQEQDSQGNSTVNEYNHANKLISQQLPEVDVMLDDKSVVRKRPTTFYGYDKKNNEIGKIDANRHTTAVVLDEAGQIIHRINPDGVVFENAVLDAEGSPIFIYDARGATWQYHYNAMKEVESVTSPMGRCYRYQYDTKKNRTAITHHDQSTWHFNYDARNNLIERYSPSRLATYFSYDRNHQMLSTHYPDNTLISNAYDFFGNCYQHIDLHGLDCNNRSFSGHVKNIDYNFLMLPSHTWTEGGMTQPNINLHEEIKTNASIPYIIHHPVLSPTRPNEETFYEYEHGLLVKEDDRALNQITNYEYDAENRRTAMRITRAGILTHEIITKFDALDRDIETKDVHRSINSLDGTYEEKIFYDAVDNRRLRYATLKPSVFNTQSPLRQYNCWYQYNPSDQVTVSGNNVFGYENAMRTRETSGSDTSLQYDLDGNLIQSNANTGTKTTFDYHANGWMDHWQQVTPLKPLGYHKEALTLEFNSDQWPMKQTTDNSLYKFRGGLSQNNTTSTFSQHTNVGLPKQQTTEQKTTVTGITGETKGKTSFDYTPFDTWKKSKAVMNKQQANLYYDSHGNLNAKENSEDEVEQKIPFNAVMDTSSDGLILTKQKIEVNTSKYLSPQLEKFIHYLHNTKGEVLGAYSVAGSILPGLDGDLVFFNPNFPIIPPPFQLSMTPSRHTIYNDYYEKNLLPIGPQYYFVNEGDTLESISQKSFGHPYAAHKIARLNGLFATSVNLRPGLMLQLPQDIPDHNQVNQHRPYQEFVSFVVGNLSPHLIEKDNDTALLAAMVKIIAIALIIYASAWLAAAYLPAVLQVVGTGVLAGLGDGALQAIMIKIGLQPKFSVNEMLEVGVSAGVGSYLKGLKEMKTLMEAAERAMIIATAAATTQLLEMKLGLRDKFEFEQVALQVASTLGAGLIDKFVNSVNTNFGISVPESLRTVAHTTSNAFLGSAVTGVPITIENLAAQTIGNVVAQNITPQLVPVVENPHEENAMNEISAKICSYKPVPPGFYEPHSPSFGGYTPIPNNFYEDYQYQHPIIHDEPWGLPVQDRGFVNNALNQRPYVPGSILPNDDLPSPFRFAGNLNTGSNQTLSDVMNLDWNQSPVSGFINAAKKFGQNVYYGVKNSPETLTALKNNFINNINSYENFDSFQNMINERNNLFKNSYSNLGKETFSGNYSPLGGELFDLGINVLPVGKILPLGKLAAVSKLGMFATTGLKGGEGISELDLLRRTTNTGVFSELKVPMQHKIVQRIAQEAGVGLDGINIKIIRDPELLKLPYLGRTTPKGGIELYPNAFSDVETLVKTLGHERTHVYQVQSFGHPDTLVNGFEHLQLNERASYTLENSYWQYYQTNKSGLFDHYGDEYVSRLAKNNSKF